MSIKDTFRKAANIFVEMPPEEEQEAASTHPVAAAASPHSPQPAPATATGGGDSLDDIDRKLAEMTRRMAGLQGGVTPEAAPSPPTSVPTLAEEKVPPSPLPPMDTTPVGDVLRPGGDLDLAALYANAGVPAIAFPAEQALEMIRSLPDSLPLDIKKQTVQVTLTSVGRATGVTPEDVAADATRKRDALTAFAATAAQQTTDFTEAAEFEIGDLERQIAAKRDAIRASQEHTAQVRQRCEAEAERLGELLTFFPPTV